MLEPLEQGQGPVHVSNAITHPEVRLFTEPESILNVSKIPPNYAGVIRPGIKIPCREGASVLTSEELQTYNKMFREKRSPDEIEKVLGKSLRPYNAPYFSVYRSECLSNPDHADQIRSLYGDAEGNIHRLKVILVSENWWEYLPHNLAAFRTSGLYCSSKRVEGQLIATRNPEPNTVKEKETSGKRVFKREKITLPCLPDQCPIYQSKGCSFSGILHFMILGVSGADVWRLPSTSWHAIGGIYKKLTHFQRLLQKKGRSIVGIPFTLYKVQANLSRWEPGKGLVRTKQWIFRIDSPDLPVANFIFQTSGFDSPNRLEDKTLARHRSPLEQNIEPSIDAQSTPGGVEDILKETGSDAPISQPKQKGPDTLKAKEDQVSAGEPEEKRTLEEDPKKLLSEIGKNIFQEIDPIGSVPLQLVKDFLTQHGKKDFDSLTLEEASDLHQKVLDAKRTSGVFLCDTCHSTLTQTVAAYSIDTYQAPLCLKCQHKSPSQLPHRTSVTPKAHGKVASFF